MARSTTPTWLTIAACVFLLMQTRTGNASVPEVTEEEVESAFLFNFAKYTEWPATSFADASSPVVICILGEESFAATVQRVVNGEKISGRSTIIRAVDAGAELRACHVAFIPSSSKHRPPQIVAAIGNAAVLTVGESKDFAHQGGMVRLYVQDGRPRFEINPNAILRSGLRISSNLLALATIVKDVSPEKER
jgi:uncharacterized protein DUF4154